MKRLLLAVVALSVVLAVAPTAIPAQARELNPTLTGQLTHALRSGMAGLEGGASARVHVPSRGGWFASTGTADLRSGARMKPSMQIPIGSVSKTMSTTVILQLVHEGRLRLNDTLDRWYPQVPKARHISIANLLNMSSGIPDVQNLKIRMFATALSSDPQSRWTPDELIAIAAKMPRAFDVPGSAYSYSNMNTVILGRIAEQVTGRPFEMLLRERVWGPLGMTRTFMDSSGRLQAPNSQTYSVLAPIVMGEPPRLVGTTTWSQSYLWAAGGVASTIADLHVWARALGTGEGVLSPAMQVKRLSRCSTITRTVTQVTEYCLGVAVVRDRATREITWITHSGLVLGAASNVSYFPRTGATLVVQANSDLHTPDGLSAAGSVQDSIIRTTPQLFGFEPPQASAALSIAADIPW